MPVLHTITRFLSRSFRFLISKIPSLDCAQAQPSRLDLESVRLALRPPSSEADVGTTRDNDNEDDLGKEPSPAAALLVVGLLSVALASLVLTTSRGAVTAARLGVQVLGRHRDDVVVVAQLASLGSEANVGNVGNRWGVLKLEARLPLILFLVLKFKLELLVLEVGQAHLGRDVGVSDAARGAASQLLVLAVIVLLVRGLAITEHGHDIGEYHAGAVVLVSIDEDTQTLKLVGSTKDLSCLRSLARDPHGEAVAV